MFSGQH